MGDGLPGENGVSVTRPVEEVIDLGQEIVIVLNPNVVETLVLVMTTTLSVVTHRYVNQVTSFIFVH